MTKHGINPVTIPGLRDKTNVTISRLWIGDEQKLSKFLTVAIWKGDQFGVGPQPEMLGVANLDEDVFLAAMQHLFIQGQMDGLGDVPPQKGSE